MARVDFLPRNIVYNPGWSSTIEALEVALVVFTADWRPWRFTYYIHLSYKWNKIQVFIKFVRFRFPVQNFLCEISAHKKLDSTFFYIKVLSLEVFHFICYVGQRSFFYMPHITDVLGRKGSLFFCQFLRHGFGELFLVCRFRT